MRVLVSGSSGLIGSAVVDRLTTDGHDVVRLVRDPSEPTAGTVTWDPAGGTLDPAALGQLDAAVHLAGEGIASHRWSRAHRARVLDSRVQGTALLAGTLGSLANPPSVLLSASAIGVYGDRGAELVTEDSPPGTGFLPSVCQAWEQATAPASAAGVRVLHLRTGIVLARSGGALGKQLRLFKLGLGGRLGSGRQYVSWIALADTVGAIAFLLAESANAIAGPVNLTAPQPVTNAEFTRQLARSLHRPAVLPVPAAAMRLVFGRQMAEEMILTGAKVLPTRLQGAGYEFAQPTLAQALAAVLAK
jgi:uncharacterized protein (TIGR01777 family)